MAERVACARCGLVWDGAVNDLVELFNHAELHRWIDADFKGKSNWSIRQSGATHEEQVASVMAWAAREIERIALTGRLVAA